MHLATGRTVDGMLYPPDKIRPSHRNISDFGGWHAYVTSGQSV